MVIERSHASEHPGAIALPITAEHQQAAQHFAAQCPLQEKASQIERNTLAVCAVNTYLRMMGIATDVAGSDSWNPMMQMMADVADLNVPGVGSLSCRAMAPEDDTCYVPPEAWENRAGYIAVVIDPAEKQATLLGFMPTIGEEESVSITQFSPVETLLDHIHALQAASETISTTSSSATSPLAENIQTTITQMSQWLEGILTNGWQTVDSIVNPPQAGFAFRSAGATRPSHIARAKAIRLEDSSLSQTIQIALVIQMSTVSAEGVDIILQVRPLGSETRLPEGLSLSIFDDDNNLIRNATSRAIDNYIQLQVMGEPQEAFSVQIRKGDAIFREQFEV